MNPKRILIVCLCLFILIIPLIKLVMDRHVTFTAEEAFSLSQANFKAERQNELAQDCLREVSILIKKQAKKGWSNLALEPGKLCLSEKNLETIPSLVKELSAKGFIILKSTPQELHISWRIK